MIDFKVKHLFFDKAPVISALDRATRAALSKFGAFVRRRAKKLIYKAKSASRPGRPPHAHGADLLRKGLLFSYEIGPPGRVVIGPAKLELAPSQRGRFVATQGRTVPQILECGGQVRWYDYRLRLGGVRSRRITIAPRPYMRPSFAHELPGLPAMWRDSIK